VAAYMIVNLEITDPAAFEAYRKVAGPTLAPYGGKGLAAFGRFEVLEGMSTRSPFSLLSSRASSRPRNGTPRPSMPH
jgi:uncharacterized protein (DUF1330 family)